MSDYPRISELAGIRTQPSDAPPDQQAAVWPFNLVLFLLGATILGVSFYFLDPNDPRLLRNAWTYAVVTPIVLLFFSILLSNLVSRLVEKSMQMAFLLSVLIHLLLLVYAVNIVIFSRMWPDVLESMAAQREQLKRETLQANLYHRMPTNTQSGKRPDHMRYVPTEHEPTQLDQAESPAIQLARAERLDMVSPSPEMERVASPHLLKREQSATTTPAISHEAASLSRSELAEAKRAASAPENYPVNPSEENSLKLEANQSAVAKRRGGQTALPRQSLATPDPTRQATEATIQRAVAPPTLPNPTHVPEPINRARQSVALAAPLGSTPVESAASPTTIAAPSTMVNDSAAPSRRSPRPDRSELSSEPLSRPTPTSRTQTTTLNQRSEAQYQLPTPTAGDSRMAIARDTAGGVTGPTAASSMRVQGPDALAAPEQSTGELRATPIEVTRGLSGARRSSVSLPEVGAPQSSSWNGTPNLAGGVSGRSPSQLSESAANGNAMAQDIAGLSGASGAIERSALGIAGPRGALAVPAGAEAAQIGESGEAQLTDNSGRSSPLEPGGSRLSRSRGNGQSLTSPDAIGASIALADNSLGDPRGLAGLPNGMQRASESPGSDIATPSVSKEGSGLPRANSNALAGRAPTETQVALPDGLASGAGDPLGEADVLQASGSLSRGSRESTQSTLAAPMQLDIEAVVGPGGLAQIPNLAGPILPRRRDLEPSMTPPQIESQRFARQEVGGPLAAGRDVAVPKPAFQQRLERLQDPEPGDETAFEPQTELAIERGLAFLAKHQRADGSWRLQDFDTPDLKVLMRSDTAATGLALLAFQGAGYTHQQFKYADTVDRAIKFLAKHQTKDGDLYIPQDPASDQNAWLYSHGIAALALCEAYGMTQDENLRQVAQRSIDFMVSSQDARLGGWRYRPGSGTDTSVTGWFMMAFKSGQLAGLTVPETTFARIEGFLELSQDKDGTPHLFRYNPFAADTPQQRHGLKPTAVMTSVGLLMRLYFGWKRDKPEMIDGADYLLKNLPTHGTADASKRDTYYWYYSTQVIFHMGGDRWTQWHDELYPLLIRNQVSEGVNEGSWDPLLPAPDLWARYGGRLYVTTMNLLSLEVSYRHLPLYEATAQ